MGTLIGEVRKKGDWATLQLLLSAGVSPNVQDGDGSTPLLNAVWFGQKPIVDELLERGANPNIRNILDRPRYQWQAQGEELKKELIAHGAVANIN